MTQTWVEGDWFFFTEMEDSDSPAFKAFQVDRIEDGEMFYDDVASDLVTVSTANPNIVRIETKVVNPWESDVRVEGCEIEMIRHVQGFEPCDIVEIVAIAVGGVLIEDGSSEAFIPSTDFVWHRLHGLPVAPPDVSLIVRRAVLAAELAYVEEKLHS